MGNVTRRGFLQVLGAATAAVAAFEVDPEFLLWRPGAKTIFLPPPKALVVADARILTAKTIEEAVEGGLKIVYPNGDVHTIMDALTHYGGFDGLKRHVEALGGRFVPNRAWQEYTAQCKAVGFPTVLSPANDSVEDAQVGIRIRMVKEWDLTHEETT